MARNIWRSVARDDQCLEMDEGHWLLWMVSGARDGHFL